MPKQVSTSGVLGQYAGRLKKAFEEHKDDPVDYGQMRVPPGITNGVARLVECKFDVYKNGANTGKPYFRAAGVIVEPATVNVKGQEVPVAGLQTSIMIPVCDTINTRTKAVTSMEDHFAEVLNEFKKLAGPEFVEGATGDDAESLAAALKEAAPFFRFSTSQSAPTKEFPDPRIWENWYGSKGLEDYSPPEDPGQVQDSTAEAPANGTPARVPARTAAKVPAKAAEPEPEPEFSEFNDIDSLAARAGDDEDARTELTKAATAAGWSVEEVEGADDWAAVAEMVKNPKATDEPEPEAADDEPAADEEPAQADPAKGDVVNYRPLVVDPKTKKKSKAKKAVECDVLAVNAKARTVTLRNLTDRKVQFKDVPFDDLE